MSKGICFKHKSRSNCQNVDKELYLCGRSDCNGYKFPLAIYDRYRDRTPLTWKSFLWFLIEVFNIGRVINATR